ncbi:MAG TPA: hydroxymethylbilane synthase [Methylomirabilota bacterium]|nr:hydroxymethylbilane synthase [Methylomirabilota bacterium]
MIRIGTRASTLALAQATSVATALRAQGHESEIVPMRTEGDRLATARLAAVGGKGLFVREIEDALLAGSIDVAVHSLKDLPAELPDGLTLAAFPTREDPRDVVVTRRHGGIAGLPAGAVVGTSSPRRRALLLAARPDLAVEPLRGNVDTRLRKLETGACDGVVLAAAGLRRLGVTPPHAELLAVDAFVPAVGQGVLGLEARTDDERVRASLARLDDRATRACALAERAFLARLGASCVTPIAGHASIEGGTLVMLALVVSEDGQRILRQHGTALPAEAVALGCRLADALLDQGAAEMVALAPRPRAM